MYYFIYGGWFVIYFVLVLVVIMIVVFKQVYLSFKNIDV